MQLTLAPRDFGLVGFHLGLEPFDVCSNQPQVRHYVLSISASMTPISSPAVASE